MTIYAVHLIEKPQEPFTVIMETALVHTDEHPFCDDAVCPCHSDMSLEGCRYYGIHISEPLEDGLMTWVEADRLFRGGQL